MIAKTTHFFIFIQLILLHQVNIKNDCKKYIAYLKEKYKCIGLKTYYQSKFSTSFLIQRLQDNKQFLFRIIPKKQQFRLEFDYLVQLQGESNIIQLQESAEDAKNIYEVLEYAKNKDLQKYRFENFDLFNDQDFILQFFQQLVKAVQKIHNLGIAHSGISPQNILVNEKNQPIISDFTQAKKFKSVSLLTGSPSELKPYVLRKVNQVTIKYDPSMDVYGLGCLLYFLLTGQPPFLAATANELKFKQKEGQIKIPSHTYKKIAQIIQGAVQYEIKDRLTIDQILEILQKNNEKKFSYDVYVNNQNLDIDYSPQKVYYYYIFYGVAGLFLFSIIIFYLVRQQQKRLRVLTTLQQNNDTLSDLNLESIQEKQRNQKFSV